MTVAHVDKETSRATNWPPDVMAVFFEQKPRSEVGTGTRREPAKPLRGRFKLP